MPALNIAFDIPQNPAFDVEDFRNKVKDYATKLIVSLMPTQKQQSMGHRVLNYEELTPEVRSLIGICKGVVNENDINGKQAVQEIISEKYGIK